MKRIQFYPFDELNAKIEEEAKQLNVSVSKLVVDLLSAHYGLIGQQALTFTELCSLVFDEVEAYISNPNSDPEFDLLSASKTFEKIGMVCVGRPSAMRAQVGKAFAQQIGTPGQFENVAIVRRANGKVKKNINNATVYRIIDNPFTMTPRISKIVPEIQPAPNLPYSYLLVDYLGREVGRILCKPQGNTRCLLIDSFCVAKKWRNKGQGLRLIEQVKKDAFESGLFDLLCVHPHGEEIYDPGITLMRTEDLIRKYENYGFVAKIRDTQPIFWMVYQLS